MSEPPIANGQSPAAGTESPDINGQVSALSEQVTTRRTPPTKEKRVSGCSINADTSPINRQLPDDDEINFIDLIIVIAKHRNLILGLPLAAAILAVAYSLQLPDVYTASTKVLPPQQSESIASAMLGQMGTLAGSVGGAFGGGNPSERYIAMLKSRRVADAIIQRFDLNALFQQKLHSRTRTILAGMTNISAEKDGLITIDVGDVDPKRAAELANAYVAELDKLTGVLAVTDSSRRRLFFERQLAQAKDSLANAEIAVKQALEKGGITEVAGQGRAMLEATGRLRAEISVKEVQISTMRTFAADRNPDLYRTQQELESMKRELAKIEGAGGGQVKTVGASARGMESLRLLRDLKYYETIYEMLAKQYELARLDESKDSAIIQVLDKAIEPDVKTKPQRSRIVIGTALVVGILAIFLAFLVEAIQKVRQEPQQAERLRLLRRYILGK